MVCQGCGTVRISSRCNPRARRCCRGEAPALRSTAANRDLTLVQISRVSPQLVQRICPGLQSCLIADFSACWRVLLTFFLVTGGASRNVQGGFLNGVSTIIPSQSAVYSLPPNALR